MSKTISLNNSIISHNYDLNIWDRRGYETEYKEEGWAIEIYTYPYLGSPYGSGEHQFTIYLSSEESKALTLGWGPELGGDYCEDSDFWLDKDTFLEIYKDIPKRVVSILNNLPGYEQRLDYTEMAG